MYRSFVKRNYFLCKRKSDSGSALTGAEKAGEDVRQKLGRDAFSVIADTDNGFSPVCLTLDLYFLFCITQCVGDDIRERTAKLYLITAHRNGSFVKAE